MKRALLFLALVFAGVTALSAQTVSARVGGELTGFQGRQLVVPIVVDMTASGGASLGSYTARLVWDTAVLSGPGAFAGNFPAPQVNNDSGFAGIFKFGGVAPLGATGLVTVAQVYFHIDSAASTPLTLAFSEMSAAGTFNDLMPALAGHVTSGTFCPAKGQWGDLDRDGASNSRDALAILSQLVGISVDTTFHMDLGDVDGDNLVNSRDALVVLSYAVGLSIVGERVLLPAPSGCGTGAATSISVFPATAQLVPNQDVRLQAQGVDGAGHGVTLPQAAWRSSDEAVAGVDANGNVVGRDAGTATITAAVGPGLKAQATITVVASRPNWYVDVKAIGAPVQLGTAAAPFEHPSMAYDLLSEGDTVRVASGTYFFNNDAVLTHGAVIIGGTPGDTTTRPVFRDLNSDTGLLLNGGLRTVVRNVVLEDFFYAVELNGARNFILEDSRISLPTSTDGYGIIEDCALPIDTLRIDRSDLIGNGYNRDGGGDGTGIDFSEGCYRLGLAVIRDSKVAYWGDAIYLLEADSVAVIRSHVSDNGGYGLNIEQENNAQPALYLSHSFVERNGYTGIYLYQSRRLVIDTSVVRATRDYGIDFTGVGGGVGAPRFLGVSRAPALAGTSQVYIHGSQIFMEADASDYNWMYASGFDSLVIKHSLIEFADSANYAYAYGDFYGNVAIVDSTRFQNIGDGAGPFYFNGQEFHADSVEFNSCSQASCSNGYGFEINSSNNVLNASLRHSRFSRIGYPVYFSSNQGIHQVADVLIDSANTGIEVGGDSSYVARNTLSRVYGPSPFSGGLLSNGGNGSRGSDWSGNNVTCSSGTGSTGIGVGYVRRHLVYADTVANCLIGVRFGSVFGGYATAGSTLLRGVLRSNVSAVQIDQNGDTSTVFVDSVGISGSTNEGVLVSQGHAVITHNRIQNNGYGVNVANSSGTVTQIHQNAFGGSESGAILVQGDSADATQNYWGDPLGPCAGASDCYSGRVDTTGSLAADPIPFVTLAPRILAVTRSTATAPRVTSAAAPAPVTRAARLEAHERTVAKHQQERAARDQQAAERRATIRAAKRPTAQAPRR
jgi:hypothetical protein